MKKSFFKAVFAFLFLCVGFAAMAQKSSNGTIVKNQSDAISYLEQRESALQSEILGLPSGKNRSSKEARLAFVSYTKEMLGQTPDFYYAMDSSFGETNAKVFYDLDGQTQAIEIKNEFFALRSYLTTY